MAEPDLQAVRFGNIEVGDSPKTLSEISNLDEVKPQLTHDGCVILGCKFKPKAGCLCEEHSPKSYISPGVVGQAKKRCAIKHADLKKGIVKTYCMNELVKTAIEFGEDTINCTRCLILMSLESG